MMNNYSFQTQIAIAFLGLVIVVFVRTVTLSEALVFYVILFHQELNSGKPTRLLMTQIWKRISITLWMFRRYLET